MVRPDITFRLFPDVSSCCRRRNPKRTMLSCGASTRTQLLFFHQLKAVSSLEATIIIISHAGRTRHVP